MQHFGVLTSKWYRFNSPVPDVLTGCFHFGVFGSERMQTPAHRWDLMQLFDNEAVCALAIAVGKLKLLFLFYAEHIIIIILLYIPNWMIQCFLILFLGMHKYLFFSIQHKYLVFYYYY